MSSIASSSETLSRTSPFYRVFMGELAIATRRDGLSKLGTDGLISCIGFAGWDPANKIGFLVHFFCPEQVHDFYSRGISLLLERVGKVPALFHCKIRGGWERTRFSHEMLSTLKEGIHRHEEIHFKIVEEDPPIKTRTPRSLSLDLEAGGFGDYSIEEDPDPRTPTEEQETRFCSLKDQETLILSSL